MKRCALFALLFLFFSPLEAQWCCWGQKYCWGCRRYMDLTEATYDDIRYGYVDNINYPDTYDLPLNYYFNYCPPSPKKSYNLQYFRDCIRYTAEIRGYP
jgi:hypothetical protein